MSEIKIGDTVMATEFHIYCNVKRILQDGAYEISFKRKNDKGVIEDHYHLVQEN